jgi:uncharacterized protein with NRDE domain
MCLILFAWRVHPQYRLVLAANRDEFHARTSAAAAFWEDRPELLGGRDLESMGTWLGITRAGRIAAVTNVRDARTEAPSDPPSRGGLAREFLCGTATPEQFAARTSREGPAFRGFNLLVGDRDTLWWTSNRGNGARQLEPGIYGVANDLLDTPWPKVTAGKAALERVVRSGPSLDNLLALLDDTHVFADAALPDTGVGLERERMLAPVRIVSPLYGTRCSSAVLLEPDGGAQFAERSYAPDGSESASLYYALRHAA